MSNETTQSNVNKIIQKLSMLDCSMGIAYCMDSEEMYIDMITDYCENNRELDLETAFIQKDWDNYQIYVHALKSTSLMIGAPEISEQAKALELAAKEKKYSKIEAGHRQLMNEYSVLLAQIESILESVKANNQFSIERPVIDDEIVDESVIVVVDDDGINRRAAEAVLKKFYKVICFSNGQDCLDYLEENTPDLLLLDIHMPNMNGFQIMDIIKEKHGNKDIPVVFLTADNDYESEVKGFEYGAMDFITKPFVSEVVLKRVRRILELRHLQRHLQDEVSRQTKTAEDRRRKVEQMSLQTVQTLSFAIDAKDSYTNGHSKRVADYSIIIAKELGLSEAFIDNLRYAALLHDIGKIGIPDKVLTKPSRLTDVEYDIIRSHTVIGGDILKNNSALGDVEKVARHHHERYDGNGYPEKISGEEIPLEARIVCIADAFDAMTTKRVYRKSLTKERVREELVNGCGTQFDPEICKLFIKLYDEGRLELDDTENQDEEADNMIDASSLLLKKVVETITNKNAKEEKDFLTGLQLRGMGERNISVAMRDDPGCFAFIDLDNLKKVNDTEGHKYGDMALKLVGEVMLLNSDEEYCCRLGGDEFLMFMPSVNEQEAIERIKKLIDDFRVKRDQDIKLKCTSLSIGLCMTSPLDDFAEVQSRADKALYHVKQNGRSGYTFYQPDRSDQAKGNEIDLYKLVKGLKNSGSYSGAMGLGYREFSKLFEYMESMKKRYNHDFHLVMVSLENISGGTLYIDEMEEGMSCMENAIMQTIRNVDICTRYSSIQFLIILFEAGNDNVNLIVDRIFKGFYKNYNKNDLQPSYACISGEEIS